MSAAAVIDGVEVAEVDHHHERRIRDRFAARAPHISVSLSSDVSPKFREYERTSTTLTNANAFASTSFNAIGNLSEGYKFNAYVVLDDADIDCSYEAGVKYSDGNGASGALHRHPESPQCRSGGEIVLAGHVGGYRGRTFGYAIE